MGTKERLLTLLQANRGVFFSGEELAAQLELSRTAVWKAINRLRDEGYPIDAVRNRGYCLPSVSDTLSAPGIAAHLKTEQLSLTVLNTVDSTNDHLRTLAKEGAAEGSVVIANRQTFGQRRGGEDFPSPADAGIYMSLLLRPQALSPKQAQPRFTVMGAVAVCEAVEAVCGTPAAIRFTNDVQVKGKKVCGVLTQATGQWVIVGIGVYVYPSEVQNDGLGCLTEQPMQDLKNRLAAEILDRFMALYRQPPAILAERFRSRSLALGKSVRLTWPVESEARRIIGIDGECRLLMESPNGEVEKLSFGEIEIISQEDHHEKIFRP